MTRSLSALCRPALPLSAVSWSRSISTTCNAGSGADLSDAGAHEAGADDADFLQARRRLVRPGAARPC